MADDKKAVLKNVKNVVLSLLTAVGVFAIFAVMTTLGNSWLKILLIGVAVAAGLFVLVTKGKSKRVSEFLVAGILIFVISFASVESYMLVNVGYPSTYAIDKPNVTLSFQGLLNGSLTQIVQNITQSSTFNLLKFEYSSNVTLRYLEFRTALGSDGGYIRATFSFDNSNDLYNFISSDGRQYTVSRSTDESAMPPFSREITQEMLSSIDCLGINWFYNQCVEVTQNRTTDLPSIDSLRLTITYDEFTNYEGIKVTLSGYHQRGSSSENVFQGFFQPDGAVISI